MKQIYISAWILLGLAAFVTALSGSLSAAAVLGFSLAALALVLSLAIWSVITQTRDWKTE